MLSLNSTLRSNSFDFKFKCYKVIKNISIQNHISKYWLLVATTYKLLITNSHY